MSNPLLAYIEQNKQDPSALKAQLLQGFIKQHSKDAIVFKASYLVAEAKDDVHLKEAAFNTMTETLSCISSEMLQDEYAKIVSGILSVKQNLLTRKVRNDKEIKGDKDIKRRNDELNRARYVASQVERKEINLTAVDEDLPIITECLASLGEPARDIFHRIMSQRPEYLRSVLDPLFTEALVGGKYQNAYKFFRIADAYGLEVKAPKTVKEAKETASAREIIGDVNMADDYMDYAIWEEAGVYKSLDKYGTPYVVSNFTMRILWHVETSDDAAFRLVAIENIHGYKHTINMNTDNFVSVGSFKKEVARKGNYLWKGDDVDLTRLQDKLQREEKPTELIKHLGWHKKGKFYAFANGIYDVSEDVFLPVDEYGIVEHQLKQPDGTYVPRNYFIRAMSKIYADKDEQFANDKKFIYQESHITFADWSKQFATVYGFQGQMALVYYVMALFSDIIFKELGRRFPILAVYGKRGTGKGTMIASLMRLFGHGQDQIMLGGSSTAVGFMRKFAQYINAIVWLDEYKNNLVPKIIESIKNIFDRIGYERGKKDNSFETESTPIHSACILSGQEMPTVEPALFTRTILNSLTETKFTDAQREEFRKLVRMEEAGLSGITVSLMKYRPIFAEKFKATFEAEQKRLMRDVSNNEVDERMYVNYAALLATAEIINTCVALPFNLVSFQGLMKNNLLEQFFVLKGSDDASKFWDVVEVLFQNGIIQEDRQFILKNGYVYLRVGDIYQHYAKNLIERRDPNGLDLQTLYKYLESDTKSYVGKKKKWFSVSGSQLWCHVFHYSEIGINLLKANSQDELKKRYKEMKLTFVDEEGEQAGLELKTREDDDNDEFTNRPGEDI